MQTQLFLPAILKHHLALSDAPAALRLAQHYQSLSYFQHALELLLHDTLDEAVDDPSTPSLPQPQTQPPSPLSTTHSPSIPTLTIPHASNALGITPASPLAPPTATPTQPHPSSPLASPRSPRPPSPRPPPLSPARLLPAVLAFLAAFPFALDVVVACARKTELRAWPTLFRPLPPPRALFEAALARGALPAAAGCLLVLQAMERADGPARTPDGLFPRSPSAGLEARSPRGDALSPGAFESRAGAGDAEAERVLEPCVRLLRAAIEREEMALCQELARFLVSLDRSGALLRRAMAGAGAPVDADADDDGGRSTDAAHPSAATEPGSAVEEPVSAVSAASAAGEPAEPRRRRPSKADVPKLKRLPLRARRSRGSESRSEGRETRIRAPAEEPGAGEGPLLDLSGEPGPTVEEG